MESKKQIELVIRCSMIAKDILEMSQNQSELCRKMMWREIVDKLGPIACLIDDKQARKGQTT